MISKSDTALNDKSCFYMCLREREKIAFLDRLMAHLQRGPGRHFITLTCGLLQEDEDVHSRRWRQIDHRWSFSTQMRAHLPSIFERRPSHRKGCIAFLHSDIINHQLRCGPTQEYLFWTVQIAKVNILCINIISSCFAPVVAFLHELCLVAGRHLGC